MFGYPTTVEESFFLSKLTGECPICPFCRLPLLHVSQTQDIYIDWHWSEEDKRYYKSTPDGSADKPFCENCNTHSWDFCDEEFLYY